MPNKTLKSKGAQEKKEEKKERYNPFEKEKYWQNFWERERVYEFNPEHRGTLYVVDTPPPTISGALHMGHIYSYTQAEVISRFKRMEGSNVRYPFGLDNNGLPTERLVEKEIGVRGQDMKLDEFIKSCLIITEKYSKTYKALWKSIGLSVDWRLEYSTISPEIQKLSQSVFKELYERELIYKEKAPALYCVECQTSFAQAEKEDKEKEAIFFDLLFKTKQGQSLIISTTRPEMLPACVAVFVNPKDKRYNRLIGTKVETPLRQEVFVISDNKVDIKKGSGAVMCCTYGDETDIYWKKTFQLPEKIILTKNGKIQDINNAVPEINGKTINEARKIIIEKLREKGFVKKEEKIRHNVDVHERCGTPIEFLPTTQWFVKILDMKTKLLKAGREINWRPSYMRKRYEEWVSNLKWDWCVSRERFYGIPIPVFNCDFCEKIVIPDENKFPLDPKTEKSRKCPFCKRGKLLPEKNVLDTWFTSALTPDINNHHPLNGRLQNKLYPMSVRPQAHDIIRTWAVYSILIGLYRHNKAPWKDLMISGHLLLKKGEKISKKKGGGKYVPEELIASQSADALRYAMCGATLGKDSYFDEKEVAKGKKLVTKIYNAGKLVLSKLQDFDPKASLNRKIKVSKLESFDQWIIQRSLETAQKMSGFFNSYEFLHARQIFEDFFWSEFCDNYLEIAKGRLSLSSDNEKEINKKRSAQFAVYHSFLSVLKMASPFIPHITEEMYHAEIIKKDEKRGICESLESKSEQGYFYRNEKIKSIHNTKWPFDRKKYSDKVSKSPKGIWKTAFPNPFVVWKTAFPNPFVVWKTFDSERIKDADLALSFISEIRKFKSKNNIGLGTELALLKIKCPKEKQKRLKPFLEDIAFIARAKKIDQVMDKKMGIEVKM
ncbi:MAG: valine--tRNA ligase [Candidatus Nealsonbacteria bacterium]|nr:valine--tRNA ligase [Candidatus Nealsonbacteria bacterium]